jgi:hypothetical protein
MPSYPFGKVAVPTVILPLPCRACHGIHQLSAAGHCPLHRASPNHMVLCARPAQCQPANCQPGHSRSGRASCARCESTGLSAARPHRVSQPEASRDERGMADDPIVDGLGWVVAVLHDLVFKALTACVGACLVRSRCLEEQVRVLAGVGTVLLPGQHKNPHSCWASASKHSPASGLTTGERYCR